MIARSSRMSHPSCPNNAARGSRAGRPEFSQPGDELPFCRAAELGEIAVRFEERLLHGIRRVDLALQATADLHRAKSDK